MRLREPEATLTADGNAPVLQYGRAYRRFVKSGVVVIGSIAVGIPTLGMLGEPTPLESALVAFGYLVILPGAIYFIAETHLRTVVLTEEWLEDRRPLAGVRRIYWIDVAAIDKPGGLILVWSWTGEVITIPSELDGLQTLVEFARRYAPRRSRDTKLQ
jgi:hypothetical protein